MSRAFYQQAEEKNLSAFQENFDYSFSYQALKGAYSTKYPNGCEDLKLQFMIVPTFSNGGCSTSPSVARAHAELQPKVDFCSEGDRFKQ
jgi:hypothetical protein